MQEFSKCLYLDGKLDTQIAIVNDEEQEAVARTNGFFPLGEADDEPDLDALRTEAEELGIKVDKRWKAERLTAEIAAAKA